MQITRETIQIETRFVFDGDSCEGCGEKYGYDLFTFNLGIAINGVVRSKEDEVKSLSLINEFKTLVEVTDEQFAQKSQSEQNEIFERMDVIMQKLSDIGIELTRPEFHLLVYYAEGYRKRNDEEIDALLGASGEELDKIIDAQKKEPIEPNGQAYVKLIMIVKI